MNNLPISNSAQPSGNASNPLQANTAAGNTATDAQTAEPFASLLAQHIGEADLSSLMEAAQAALAAKGEAVDTNTSPNDAQDVAAAATDMPGEPVNILAAILQQLPVDNRNQKTDGQLSMQRFNPVSNPEDGPTIQLSATDPLLPDAGKRTEPFTTPTTPAQQTSQTMASSAILGTTPGAPASNTPPTGALPAIGTPLGSNGWADEFSQKINWLSTQQNHVAELRLNPPNLGPLDVVLKISDNQATALFTSPHGAVRDAVENALPKLRELLADNGIMLGDTSISDQPPRDRNMDGFMNSDSGTAARHDASGIASDTADLSAAAPQTAMARRHNGMVDTFA